MVAFEILYTVFEIPCVVDACLQDGKLVHFLAFAGWDHVL